MWNDVKWKMKLWYKDIRWKNGRFYFFVALFYPFILTFAFIMLFFLLREF
jgi:hypothetical protein